MVFFSVGIKCGVLCKVLAWCRRGGVFLYDARGCGLARAAHDQHVDWSDGHSLGYKFVVLDAPASQDLAADFGSGP